MRPSLWAFALVAAAFAACGGAKDQSDFGDEDLWVFTAFWSPQVCRESDYKQAALCKTPTLSMKNSLVAGSLEPSYNDGSTQQGMCRYEYGEFLPSNINAAGGATTLQKYWPYLLATDVPNMWDGGYTGSTPEYLWTCGGMHQAQYLSKIVELATKVNREAFPLLSSGKQVKSADVRKAFHDKYGWEVLLQCDEGSKLARVTACFSKTNSSDDPSDPYYGPKDPISCPKAISKSKDTCKSDSLDIASFDSATSL